MARVAWNGLIGKMALGAFASFASLVLLAGPIPVRGADAEPAPPEGQTYTGSKRCASCHFDQYMSWKKTKHSKAFDDLTAKYQKDQKCLKCHTTGNRGMEVAHMADVLGSPAGGGDVFPAPKSYYQRRTLAMQFKLTTDAMFQEFRDELFARCNGDEWPLIIVPVDTEAMVLHARIDRRWRVIRTFVGFYDSNDLVVAEQPFPPVEP